MLSQRDLTCYVGNQGVRWNQWIEIGEKNFLAEINRIKTQYLWKESILENVDVQEKLYDQVAGLWQQ